MKLCTAKEAADFLGLRYSQVIKMFRNGEIPGARKIGWVWVISLEDLRYLRDGG
jgi:excisionase family DNA binding protein